MIYNMPNEVLSSLQMILAPPSRLEQTRNLKVRIFGLKFKDCKNAFRGVIYAGRIRPAACMTLRYLWLDRGNESDIEFAPCASLSRSYLCLAPPLRFSPRRFDLTSLIFDVDCCSTSITLSDEVTTLKESRWEIVLRPIIISLEWWRQSSRSYLGKLRKI